MEEIEKAAPKAGEEERLEAEKALISHRAKLAEALMATDQALLLFCQGLLNPIKR